MKTCEKKQESRSKMQENKMKAERKRYEINATIFLYLLCLALLLLEKILFLRRNRIELSLQTGVLVN